MTARTKHLLFAVVAFLMATAWAGRTTAQGIYVDYYTPQFYMDNLVFYDETGAPIYYEDNTPYAVPSDYPGYDELVNHFLNNEDAYFQWFENIGYANLHFRRTPVLDYYKPRYYQGYMVFYEGGRPVYYVDGVSHVVTPSDRRYARLMRHYNQYRAEYGRWYRSVGRHYRWYRRPVYTDYYRPMYLNGYLIFYDASGLPFYYMGGRTVYIPRTHKRYHNYVSHYRTHRHNYDRWYRDKGRRHHDYRQPKSYRKRVIAPKAPRATQGRAENRKYRPSIRHRHKPTIAPKPHQPPPRVEPKHHGHRDRPHVTPPPERPKPPPRVAPPPERPGRPDRVAPQPPKRPGHPSRVTPPPRRPEPPARADKPRPPPAGIRGKHEKAKETKPPKKPLKPAKKKHGR